MASIVLFIIAAIVIYFGYRLKKAATKYKDIPGISLLDFFLDASNLPKRTAQFTKEKFAKICTPVVTFVLATHPESAKVKKKLYLINSVLMKGF